MNRGYRPQVGTSSRGPSERGYTIVELMAAMLITLFVMGGVYGLMLQNQRTYQQQTQMADVQQAARVALDLMTREIRMAGSDPGGMAFSQDHIEECEAGAYKPPDDERIPDEDDIAPITVAEPSRIRVKMDRPMFTLGRDPITPTPTPSPSPPIQDCNNDGDHADDDEFLLSDGYIDDESEDVEYLLENQTLYRIEHMVIPRSDNQCRPCSWSATPPDQPVQLPIVDHVIDLEFKYYDSDGPSANPAAPPCPEGVFATSADYEAARDICDPPMDPDALTDKDETLIDFRNIRRVRIRIVVQADKPDPFNPERGTHFNSVTLTSDVTLRNRVSF